MQNKEWFIYILKCSDNTLYTGITNNLEKRIKEHNESKLGAKYTKARRPVVLIYNERYKNRSEASKREIEIKKMTKSEKENFIKSGS